MRSWGGGGKGGLLKLVQAKIMCLKYRKNNADRYSPSRHLSAIYSGWRTVGELNRGEAQIYIFIPEWGSLLEGGAL